MFEYILNFDNKVIEYELKNDWKSAAEYSYQLWKASPSDIRKLLCAGTEIWYSRLEKEYWEHSPQGILGAQFCSTDQLENMLWDVSSYGEQKFSQNACFLAYFGYMYQVMPYYFLGCGENVNPWITRGQDMMRLAEKLDPGNLFAAAMACEMDDVSHCYNQTCRRLWEQITPEQWGSSSVQKYFFRILNGESFYR